jgi:hypothetical protein
MRLITPVAYAGLLAVSIYAALAQSSPIQLASTTTDVDQPVVTSSLAPQFDNAKPEVKPAVRVGRRESCRQTVAAKHLKRRDARDQLQLCVAQARVECLQQAIDQKVRGASQRRLYVKACVAS